MQITNLKRRGLLDVDRAEKRLDAADARYEDAQKKRAEHKFSNQRALAEAASSSDEAEQPPKRRHRAARDTCSGSNRSKSTTPGPSFATKSRRSQKASAMSFKEQLVELSSKINDFKSALHYKVGDEIKTLMLGNTYTNKDGAKCIVGKPVQWYGDDAEDLGQEPEDGSGSAGDDIVAYECQICKLKPNSALCRISLQVILAPSHACNTLKIICAGQIVAASQGLPPQPSGLDCWAP